MYEDYPGGNVTYLTLTVIDYAVNAGVATPTSVPLPAPYAYPHNISGTSTLYPGSVAVSIGDFDGDGVNEIAVVYQAFVSGQLTLQGYIYKYAPPAQGQSGSLTSIGEASGLLAGVSIVQNPLEIDHGDFDGDGKEEIALLYLSEIGFKDGSRNRQCGAFGGTPKWCAHLVLGILQWQPTGGGVLVTVGSTTLANVESWYDGGGPDKVDPQFHDIRLATGLFKFDPNAGFTLDRRQIAVAYKSGQSLEPYNGVLMVQLLAVGDVGSPTWAINTLTWNTQAHCIGHLGLQRSSFSLVAGAWAGVKANPASPLWGVAVAYEPISGFPGMLVQMGRVDNPQGQLEWAGSAVLPRENSFCAEDNKNALVAFDVDGDSLRLGAPVHFVINNAPIFDYILEEPPKHLDYLPGNILASSATGMVNVSRIKDFNVSYTDNLAPSSRVRPRRRARATSGARCKHPPNPPSGKTPVSRWQNSRWRWIPRPNMTMRPINRNTPVRTRTIARRLRRARITMMRWGSRRERSMCGATASMAPRRSPRPATPIGS